MAFTHEIETQFQKGQLGVEVDYGTPVAASIALGSVSLSPAPKKTTNSFTARGYLLPTVLATGREYTEIGFEGEATYEEVGYFVKDVVSDGQIDPMDLHHVYTVEAGGLQIPGSVVNAWTLRGDRDRVQLSGSMLGKKGIVQAPTGALVAPEQTPVSAAGVVITLDSAPLTKLVDWELAVSDLWGQAFFVGDNEPANILQRAITASLRVKVEADEDGMDILEVGSTIAVVITCTTGGDVLTISFDAKVGEPTGFSDEEGVYAIEHNLTVMNQATTAIDVTVA